MATLLDSLDVAPVTVDPTIVLRVAGNATGKARPRFNRATGVAYDTAENRAAENDVRAVWREAGEPRLPDDMAVAIYVLIVAVRPAGHFRKDGSLSAEGLRHPVPRNKKPDVDNALKLIMDSLNGRAYRDDVQVARACVERWWGRHAETLIKLRPMIGAAV